MKMRERMMIFSDISEVGSQVEDVYTLQELFSGCKIWEDHEIFFPRCREIYGLSGRATKYGKLRGFK